MPQCIPRTIILKSEKKKEKGKQCLARILNSAKNILQNDSVGLGM
jgi:hypothetical protein